MIKPNRCTVIRDSKVRLVVWGRPGAFKDLFWAALTHTKGGGDEADIVVDTRDGENISEEDKAWRKAIGKRCDFDVVHLHRRMTPVGAHGFPQVRAVVAHVIPHVQWGRSARGGAGHRGRRAQ